MTNIKSTKRALGSSVLALFLCFAMLLGTTFAWFTDSVTSANNIITAGNLDIEVYYAYPSDVVDGDIPEDAWKLMQSDVSIFDNNALWEPGYTQAVFFKFVNAGSLALQYEFKVDILNETLGKTKEGTDIQLSNHINAYICNNFQWNYKQFLFTDRNGATNPAGAPNPYYTTLGEAASMATNRADNYTENELSLDSWQWLEPTEVTYATMVLWMPTTVGNEVNHNGKDAPSIELGITVLATQYNNEKDSFGNNYDADAKFPVVSAPEKLPENAATEGTTLTSGADNKGVAVTVPAATINSIKGAGAKSVSLTHTEPKVVGNAIVFDAIDIVDQTGKVIELSNLNLTDKIAVTLPLPAGSAFADGAQVEVYHDGKFVTYATVKDGKISYEVAHFCEVEIKAAEEVVLDNTIDSVKEFLAFAAAVNAGNSYAGQTVVLGADLDLAGVTWTPIGTSSNPFKGTFDGNGKVIKNLSVLMAGKNDVGLFGYTTDGEIKNVTVENAKVAGRLNVGVVAGTPYTSKYTNITVKGHVEVDGMAYVGGVAGKNAYANWTNITVNVDEKSYVKAISIEDGTAYRTYVGGVVGFNGEGGHTFSNITSNIDVYGSTCDVGGAFGIAHYGNKFENVTVTGNVTITDAAEADEAEEIGGIAGVWHNENGTSVAFTKCNFTGKLSANVEGVDLENNTITGKAYGNGNGSLVIDGVEYVAVDTGAELQDALNNNENVIFVGNITINKADCESNAYGATGINVKNGQIIDGAGYSFGVNAWGTWDSAISTTGGTIKNLTINSAMRGIFVNHNGTYSETVVLENVTIAGTVYTISCDQGTNQNLVATNCTFNGWTSYAATIGDVEFINCSFGEGQGYKYCRPYAPTKFVDCTFGAGYKIDAVATVTLENCTIDGVALTAENLATLVTSGSENASVK